MNFINWHEFRIFCCESNIHDINDDDDGDDGRTNYLFTYIHKIDS